MDHLSKPSLSQKLDMPLRSGRQKSFVWGAAGLLFILTSLLVSIGLGAIWIHPSVVIEGVLCLQFKSGL